MQNQHTEERAASVVAGLPMLILAVVLGAGGVFLLIRTGIEIGTSGSAQMIDVVSLVLGFLLLLLGSFLPLGLFVLQPNQANVIILFGRYIGTVHTDGWHWTNPFTIGARKKVSLRIRNFDSERVKVNDKAGNPVEIAAVVAWRVADTAKAIFDVNDYERYVAIQAETAVRHLATEYPYDSYEEGGLSLSGNVDEVSETLQVELQQRLAAAGVVVVEARLSHLSYAPEIAGAMLRRQQANAIVAARQRIVEGAVGMVETALAMLDRDNIVQLDEEKKAAMISNLLVVLTGEQAAHPVVNAGTLYQ